MKNCDFQKLDWDTSFFGRNVFQLNSRGDCRVKEQIEMLFNTEKAWLIYVFSSSELPAEIVTEMNGKLVDVKLLFAKSLRRHYDEIDFSQATSFKDKLPDPELYALALQSGIESRFRIDSRLPEGSFQKMYYTWLEKSVDHQLADEVFVYRSEGMIIGFITVKLKQKHGEIGLFAVDEKFRGRKIGKLLLQRAEKYLTDNNLYSITIPTQEANKGATEFYRANDYNITNRTFVYHFIKNTF